LYNEYLKKEAVERSGNLKIGQVVRAVKYADYIALLVKEKAVL
jgi:hypothetical protein